MGNTLHQIDEKVQRDKKSRVHPKLANQYQEEQSDSPVLQNQPVNGWLNWWQKLIYLRDQQQSRRQQVKEGERIYEQERKSSINQNAIQQQNDRFNQKFLFSPQLLEQSNKIKLSWKHITSLPSHSIIPKIIHTSQTKDRQIFYAQINRSPLIRQANRQMSIIFAEKIEIDENQMVQKLKQGARFENPEERAIKIKEINQMIYQWRVYVSKKMLRSNDENCFPIVGIYEAQSSRLNISFSPKITLLQQLIPYRLTYIRHLTHLQGIYVLQQCLIGFKLLYDIFGYFLIEDQMVGFNANGRVRVWISSLFWSNLCYGIEKKNSLLERSRTGQGFEQMRRYEEEDMVDMVWMMMQKYALFHSSIVIETGGFRRCTFAEALQLVIRHKSAIIDRRDKSLGLVRFVDRLQFEEDRDQGYQTKTQNLHEIKSTKNSNTFQHIQNSDYMATFPPSMVNPQPNPQSHINLIDEFSTPHNKRRAPIFDKGYTHTMSNNMSTSNFQGETRQRFSFNRDKTEQSTEHVRFINIKSLK